MPYLLQTSSRRPSHSHPYLVLHCTFELVPVAENMIDVLGSVAFTPVKSDMLGNIKVQSTQFQAVSVVADAELESPRPSASSTHGV